MSSKTYPLSLQLLANAMVGFVHKLGLFSALGVGLVVTQKDRLDDCPWWSSLTFVRFGRAAFTVRNWQYIQITQ